MKKLLIFIMCASIGLNLLNSCGSSKKTATLNGDRMLELSKSQIMAEDKPTIRYWGSAIDVDMMDAKMAAIEIAKSELGGAIKTKIFSALEQGSTNVSKYLTTDTVTRASDKSQYRTISVQTVASEVVSKTVVIHTDLAITAKGEYRAYVCLEYQGDKFSISDDVCNMVEDVIPYEEKEKLRNDLEDFRKKLNKQFSLGLRSCFEMNQK